MMRWTARAALAVFAPSLLGGCATALPPAQPVPSIEAIAGKWTGTVQFGRGPYEFFYLTINPDGSLAASWGITTRHGKVSLEGARTRFTLYIWSGDLQYFAAGDRRVLILKEDFGTFDAQLTPAP